jgi:hypothetical protein
LGIGRAESKLADSRILLFWPGGVEPALPVVPRETRARRLLETYEVIATPRDLWIAEWTFRVDLDYGKIKGTNDAILWGCKKILPSTETKILRRTQSGLRGAGKYEYQ